MSMVTPKVPEVFASWDFDSSSQRNISGFWIFDPSPIEHQAELSHPPQRLGAFFQQSRIPIVGPAPARRSWPAPSIATARAKKDFIVVDCASLTETLMESVLFGHERGAFTEASADRTGLVRQAHEGTLFLDEIGELPLTAQKAFLRVLQERRLRPVGSDRRAAFPGAGPSPGPGARAARPCTGQAVQRSTCVGGSNSDWVMPTRSSMPRLLA
jgi:hypothetical protein